MGRIIVDLSLGKDFSAALKTFSVYGRDLSSLSSPSSLTFGKQLSVQRVTGCALNGLGENHPPFFGVILPILPNSLIVKTTHCGALPANRNIL